PTLFPYTTLFRSLGDADHLADARPGLAGGEVGAHPVAQVGALADVEDLAALVREEVDAGGVRQRLGEMGLALLLGRGGADERLERLQRVDPEVQRPLAGREEDAGGARGV